MGAGLLIPVTTVSNGMVGVHCADMISAKVSRPPFTATSNAHSTGGGLGDGNGLARLDSGRLTPSLSVANSTFANTPNVAITATFFTLFLDSDGHICVKAPADPADKVDQIW